MKTRAAHDMIAQCSFSDVRPVFQRWRRVVCLSICLSVFCNNLIVQGFVAASSRSDPQRNQDHSSLRTRERCSPSPPMFRIMVSPAFRKIGIGFLPAPTPGGVPVVMISPLRSDRLYASTKLKTR